MSLSPARALVRTLTTWLAAPASEAIERSTRLWAAAEWSAARRLITIHGLAAHLVRSVPAEDLTRLLPVDVHDWLAGQDSLNSRRIDLLHQELAVILQSSHAAGIDVMPLKGAVLTTMDGADRYRRPMGDLDLLVRPADRQAMGKVLSGLGYTHRPEPSPRPTHDVYLQPGAVVVSRDEHPDNPRRVEIHTEVLRHLWGWIDDDDLTDALWAGARRGEVLGQPALLPSPAGLFAHVCVHASADLLVGRGRLIQWLDLAGLASRLPASALQALPHARLAFPAIRLASRTVPHLLPRDAAATIESNVPPGLARWAARVPLDDRCGLMIGPTGEQPSSIAERWRRWRPARWRLAVAYGSVPLPVGLARYGHRLIVLWRSRVSDGAARAGE